MTEYTLSFRIEFYDKATGYLVKKYEITRDEYCVVLEKLGCHGANSDPDLWGLYLIDDNVIPEIEKYFNLYLRDYNTYISVRSVKCD